jgi:glycosyltransferase involved in cell wall biosynthesis
LGIPDDHFVFLYAAKLEPRKRPMELLEAFLAADLPKTTLLFVGSGELEGALHERVRRSSQSSVDSSQHKKTEDSQLTAESRAAGGDRSPQRPTDTANSAHRVVFLPFQNQSVMPVVYRLGDALVLPSGYGETWGLAVNEAQACGRPSLVSDCVGCARDIVREGENGSVFRTDDWEACVRVMRKMVNGEWRSKREVIRVGAWGFDTARGVDALLSGLRKI